MAVHSLTTSPSRAYSRRPREPEVRVPLEDSGDVRTDGVALDAIAGRVVLEDHPGSMEREDRLHVMGVPGVVVALDRLLELGGGIPGSTRASIAAKDIDVHR